jgi:hypothetical protein
MINKFNVISFSLELIKSAFPDITQTNKLSDIKMELGENLYYYVLELTNNYQNCNQTFDYDIEYDENSNENDIDISDSEFIVDEEKDRIIKKESI